MELYQNEIWKPIQGFENYYITNYGRVWSTISNQWLKPTLNQRGNYKRYYVSLGRKSKKQIHRLVAEAFLPNPYNLPEVDHKDTNGLNNHVDNLRWCTHDENMANELTQENVKKNTGYFVEIEEIATGKKFYGYEQVSTVFGVSRETVRNHLKNRVQHPRWRLTGKRVKENPNNLLTNN